eukprot:TRINITY_DN990_c0_g2_i6.p1 TRINITY_DN990_c0_g2~~TRINITY_DN990_c0_g2_i6.p1  ORF type:complete len:214 (-),score=13.69 TRINITY_DN990_c0_g2_i6:23-664(-)
MNGREEDLFMNEWSQAIKRLSPASPQHCAAASQPYPTGQSNSTMTDVAPTNQPFPPSKAQPADKVTLCLCFPVEPDGDGPLSQTGRPLAFFSLPKDFHGVPSLPLPTSPPSHCDSLQVVARLLPFQFDWQLGSKDSLKTLEGTPNFITSLPCALPCTPWTYPALPCLPCTAPPWPCAPPCPRPTALTLACTSLAHTAQSCPYPGSRDIGKKKF